MGDSAHSTTPNMGQGAAMGIESAYVFGQLLKEHSFDETASLYSARRYDKVKAIREKSMLIGKIAHTQSKIMQKIRNVALKLTPDSVALKELEKSIFDY